MNDENATRKKQLKKIVRVIESMRRGSFNNPATWRFLVAFVAGFFVAIFFGYTWPVILMGWLGGSIVGYFWVRAAKYQTWDAYIYALLADYDPVNKEAYSALQEKVRKAKDGEFYADDILLWVDEERAYMGPAPRQKHRSAEVEENRLREVFLSKKP